MSRHWLDDLAALGEPAVLVTVAQAEGSTPREAGTRMIVTARDVLGTIGGGNLEFKAIALARERLRGESGGGVAFHRFALGPSLGQCCGGATVLALERIAPGEAWVAEAERRVAAGDTIGLASGGDAPTRVLDAPPPSTTFDGERLVERIAPIDFVVWLFGAGHVGHAIVQVLATLPCRLTWIDEREAQFPAQVPSNTRVLWSDAPALDARDAPAGTHFLVMTHSHALDQDICEQVLRRADYAYLGLIGSATKRALFERRLAERGIARERLATLVCPIGIAGIASKEPGAIAIAVAAQLEQLREARTPR